MCHATVPLAGPPPPRRVCLRRWPTCPLVRRPRPPDATAAAHACLRPAAGSASMSFLRNTSASSVRLVVRASAWASCLPWRPELAVALRAQTRRAVEHTTHASAMDPDTVEQRQSNASPAIFLPSLSGSPCILPSPPSSLSCDRTELLGVSSLFLPCHSARGRVWHAR
jgi:hypothetical protein